MSILKKSSCPNLGEATISGSFDVAAGTGVVSGILGSGFAVEVPVVGGGRTPGVWDIILDQSVTRFISVVVGVAAAAATDSIVTTDIPVAATRRFSINLWDVSGGALADKASRISFVAKVSKSVSP